MMCNTLQRHWAIVRAVASFPPCQHWTSEHSNGASQAGICPAVGVGVGEEERADSLWAKVETVVSPPLRGLVTVELRQSSAFSCPKLSWDSDISWKGEILKMRRKWRKHWQRESRGDARESSLQLAPESRWVGQQDSREAGRDVCKRAFKTEGVAFQYETLFLALYF